MKNGYLYAIIVLLLLVIVGGGVYIVSTKNSQKPSDEDQKTEEKTEKEPTIKDAINYGTIKVDNEKIKESFNVVMNGENIPLEVEFTYFKDGSVERITGAIKDEVVYLLEDSDLKKNFTTNFIRENFSEDNLKFIKGKDGKTYLTVLTRESLTNSLSYYLLVFNDSLKPIDNVGESSNYSWSKDKFTIITTNMGFGTVDNTNPWFEDQFEVCKDSTLSSSPKCNVNLRLLDDRIEYIELTGAKDDYYTLEKRMYTVNNDSLSYTTSSQYKAEVIAGQAP